MSYKAPERGSSPFSGLRQVRESLGTLNFSSGRGGRHEFAIPQACAVVGTIRCGRTSREVGLSRCACTIRTSVGSVTSMSHRIEPSPALSTVPPDFLTLDDAAAVLRVGRTMADHSYAMPQRTSHPIPRTRLVSEMPRVFSIADTALGRCTHLRNGMRRPCLTRSSWLPLSTRDSARPIQRLTPTGWR